MDTPPTGKKYRLDSGFDTAARQSFRELLNIGFASYFRRKRYEIVTLRTLRLVFFYRKVRKERKGIVHH